MNDFLPFALPDIGDEEIDEVISTLKSGWVTTGPVTKKFESNFASYLGGGVEAISVNSATAGLHLALEALGIGPGDEVLTTVYTFTATAEVVRYLGAHPVFVDIDPKTLNIDVTKIEERVTKRTKAIIPVHFAGLPCNMDAIFSIAKKHNLKIVEDAAHALPARYNGQLIGTLASDVTVFSFYATKTMTTGEGGMIVTRDAMVAQRIKTMRLHGINRDAFDRYTSNKPSWFYEVVAPGFKYNLTDIASSIGIHQLTKLENFREKRAKMALLYDENLKKMPLTLPAKPNDNLAHAWHLYTVRLNNMDRDQFVVKMAEKGVGTSVHFIPLHLQPYWRDTYKLSSQMFPVASEVFSNVVSLPLYTRMSSSDQMRVVDAMSEILRKSCG
ncbi:DegT/DnrJ/EryC1/StrS family aminotransferase [Bdellovibrio sp. HCB-110]|uniref:DegT/DnrJ/EryC1/StrS family aminotransferase n=1 Tax=Bdellovibrio sp. HCB-110 TaxID=3391182 RepID=UPI0039B48B25